MTDAAAPPLSPFPPVEPTPLRLGVLIGGGGRTLLNLADRIDARELPARLAAVLASREDLPGVRRARARGLRVEIANPAAFETETAFHDAVSNTLREAGADLVCLAGYLRWLRVDPWMVNRVLNIHPALLPDFGGAGMYGLRVHRAVLESGVRRSGCTVHFVNDEYDRGPILLQKSCPVRPDDTPETLAARVFALEREAYPEAIGLIASGRVRLDESGARIVGPHPRGDRRPVR